jgi:hypothetical protein
VWYIENRGLRGLSTTEKAYARLALYAGWLGIQLPSQYTPEERRQRLTYEVPEAKQPINNITYWYMNLRFAPPRRERRDAAAKDAWTQARQAFIRRKLQQLLGRTPKTDIPKATRRAR